jgi:glutamyl/glutaminyl-tRNA synthetase
VPLILGSDKKRLSKRHGATSVADYARRGCLPEAMVNYLALLGWSPGKEGRDRELFTAAELAEAFDLGGMSGGNAVFNTDKLDWFNQQYIMRLAPEDLARRVRPFFEAAGLWSEALVAERQTWFLAVLELLKPRAKTLDAFVSLGRFFFGEAVDFDPAAVEKHLLSDRMDEHLEAVAAAFAELPTFDPASAEATLREVADARGVKASMLIHALRVAITGRSASPGIFEVAALVGRPRVRTRLAAAVGLISSSRG